MSEVRFVLAYDIAANRRRGRVAKKLLGYLRRVQKSVFEGDISDDRLASLKRMLQRETRQDQDSVRIYRLCRRCLAGTEVIGLGTYVERGDEDLVV